MKKLLLFVAVSTLLFFGLHAQNAASQRYEIIKKDGKPIGLLDKISKERLNLIGLPEATPNKKVAKAELNMVTKKSTKEDVATITLTVVGDPWENGTGVQLLLDQDTEIVDHFEDWFWNTDEMFYTNSEYTIPENATYNLSDPEIVIDATASIDIPEGTYDFIFFRPWPFLEMLFILNWAGTEDYAMGDDFLFLAGFEYIFTIASAGEVEFETPEDLALSKIILPQPSLNLTDQETISVVLYNNGITDISGDVELAYKVNGSNEIIETAFIELASGDEITHAFNTKADFSGLGFYTVEARLAYEFDTNPYNNMATGKTKKMTLIELPFVDEFETSNSMLSWFIIDANGDGYSWTYDDLLLPGADGETGSLQVLCQSYGADEYLLTDPMHITESGVYDMTFYAARLGNDNIKVFYGTTPNVAEMELFEVVTPTSSDWSEYHLSFDIETPGNYTFAFYYYAVSSEGGSGINFDKFKLEQQTNSIAMLSKDQLKLYPNPVTGVLNIECKDVNIDKVIVSNILGKIVYTTSNINNAAFRLNTTDFTSGFYLISVQTAAGVVHSKFVVE